MYKPQKIKINYAEMIDYCMPQNLKIAPFIELIYLNIKAIACCQFIPTCKSEKEMHKYMFSLHDKKKNHRRKNCALVWECFWGSQIHINC